MEGHDGRSRGRRRGRVPVPGALLKLPDSRCGTCLPGLRFFIFTRSSSWCRRSFGYTRRPCRDDAQKGERLVLGLEKMKKKRLGAGLRTPEPSKPMTENPTDLASVPLFMRWFENSYGVHTLAAILHSTSSSSEAQTDGELGSDTLSDRFFREMMKKQQACRCLSDGSCGLRLRFAHAGPQAERDECRC